MKHKHYDLIEQWAKDTSLKVQYKCEDNNRWIDVDNPMWVSSGEYRIKPVKKERWARPFSSVGLVFIDIDTRPNNRQLDPKFDWCGDAVLVYRSEE